MALPNDVSRACDEISKIASSNPEYLGKKKVAARQLCREQFSFETPVDGSAAATTAHTATAGNYMPRDGRLLGARFLPHAAGTADNTNNTVLTLNKSDGLGGAATPMASVTSNVAAGNFVAGAFKALANNATPANIRFAKGQLISPSIAKGGTGLATPAGTWIFDVEWEGTDDYEVV